MPPQLEVKRSFAEVLRSPYGILRLLQILLGASLWVTIAANKYEGAMHFVLFVAVLFWLLTLALLFLTVLGKQDLVPLVGGERWLPSNVAHDLAATLLYLSAAGVAIYKTEKYTYCNLEAYQHSCLYKVYLTATVFACLNAAAYLVSAVYGCCRKKRGEATVAWRAESERKNFHTMGKRPAVQRQRAENCSSEHDRRRDANDQQM
ncbi:hypothetical protein SKAU_G00179340 [Synaphobranchus kaupii]|uniref:MARVEL domain-containing protein n=1 Tax=Synaphobranchus kaupii TaxID=118154 RepID=A0A9Q1IZD1_SYNKA|nr:hypothetical protein SKAU_G00179340 [Synaphobranchus kaupii]